MLRRGTGRVLKRMIIPRRGRIAVVELAGMAGIVTGIWMIWEPAAIITGGFGVWLWAQGLAANETEGHQ